VFDYLLEDNRRVGKILGGMFNTDEMYKSILQNNIYGVDLNAESVEITKLSLWLKSAQKGKKLSNLDNNIKCGNSLIDDPAVAGDKAFKWEEEFPWCHSELDSESRGFDVIVGNPPYVDSESMTKYQPEIRKSLTKKYDTAQGNWDLFVLFFERSLTLLNKNRFLTFIIPNKILSARYATAFRAYIHKNYSLCEIYDLSKNNVFDVDVYPVILTLKTECQQGSIKITKKDDIFGVHSKSIIYKLEDNWALYLDEQYNFYSKITSKFSNLPKSNIYPSATVSEAYEIKKSTLIKI